MSPILMQRNEGYIKNMKGARPCNILFPRLCAGVPSSPHRSKIVFALGSTILRSLIHSTKVLSEIGYYDDGRHAKFNFVIECFNLVILNTND